MGGASSSELVWRAAVRNKCIKSRNLRDTWRHERKLIKWAVEKPTNHAGRTLNSQSPRWESCCRAGWKWPEMCSDWLLLADMSSRWPGLLLWKTNSQAFNRCLLTPFPNHLSFVEVKESTSSTGSLSPRSQSEKCFWHRQGGQEEEELAEEECRRLQTWRKL